MANTQQVIDIIFRGVDSTAGAVASALGNVESGAKKIQDFTGPIASVTTGILKFEAAILASGAAITLLAVKTAGDFDSAFREISTLIDAPIDDLAAFRKGILDYAGTSTQSLDQITRATYNAISAGVEYTDSIGVLRQAEQLAVAGKADLNDSLVVLVSTLNAYGLGMDSAQRFSDALFSTVKLGQTTLPDLAGNLASVTGLAATAGVEFEEVLAAIAALTATGTPTSQAITQIQGAIAAILKPTQQAQALASELGLEFNLQRLQAVGLSGILAEVADKTGGNADQMAKLFGRVEALNGVLTLTGLGADKFSEALDEIRNSSGATDAAFEKMAGSLELGTQQIQNSLKTLLISIGTPLLDEFGGIQQAIAAIFQAIGASVDSGALGDFVKQIESLAQDAERFLSEIAKNLPEALSTADFSKFIDGLNVVKDAVLGLFNGADLSTADGLRKAIELTGSGFMTLSTFTASTITAIGPFVEILADVAKFVAELDPDVVRLAGSIGGIAIVAGPVLTGLTSVAGALKVVALGITGAGGVAAALTVVASSPAGVALSLSAMGAAAYELGGQLYALTDRSKEYAKIQAEIAAVEAERVRTSGAITERLAEISKQTGVNIDTLDEFNTMVEYGALVFDEASQTWITATQQSTKAMQGQTSELINWGARLGDLTGSLEDNRQSAIDTAAAYYELAGNTPEVARRMAEMEAGTSKVAEVMKDAEKESDKLREALAKLASDERIKALEIGAKLGIAQIEADTKRMEAAFQSVGEVIGTLNKGLVETLGIFAGLSNDDSFSKKWTLEENIDKQNKRLDEQLELQKKLVEEQIKTMEARRKSIESGGALVNIDSSGLEPALEMIMWQILEKVQLRVNEEAAEFLLGIQS